MSNHAISPGLSGFPPDEPTPPVELETALLTCVKCPCGGEAITGRLIGLGLRDKAMFRDKADDNALICEGCNRAVAFSEDWLTTAGAWNQEIREELCLKHSWLLQPPDGPACKRLFKCVHCGALLRQ